MLLQVSQEIMNMRMEIQNPEFCDSRLKNCVFRLFYILKIKYVNINMQ